MYDIYTNPPEWFLNAFGLFWWIWTVSEFKAQYLLWVSRRNGVFIRRDTLDRLKLYSFVLYTLVWWCWRIYGP